MLLYPVADLHSKILGAPPGVQILSISRSFWEILAKSYVGTSPLGSWRPHLGEILDPLLVPMLQRRQTKDATSRVFRREPYSARSRNIVQIRVVKLWKKVTSSGKGTQASD